MIIKNKVILISIDAIRADAVRQCKHPVIEYLMKNGTYSFNHRSIMPTSTLPCHFTMLTGVSPEVHKNVAYDYVPIENPPVSIFEHVRAVGARTGMFSGWDLLRYVAPPCRISVTHCLTANSGYIFHNVDDHVDSKLTDDMINYLKSDELAFAFLYLPDVDHFGHNYKWMSEPYMETLNTALDNVQKVIDEFSDKYTIIVTTDHGGHDHRHGTDMDEDMIIPLFILGKDVEKGKEIDSTSILDITPTIAKIMGLDALPEWEGKSVL